MSLLLIREDVSCVVLTIWVGLFGLARAQLEIISQSTTQHVIFWAGLARTEDRPGPGLKFWPVPGTARTCGLGLGWPDTKKILARNWPIYQVHTVDCNSLD